MHPSYMEEVDVVEALDAGVHGLFGGSRRCMREYAAKHGVEAETVAVVQGLREKAAEFKKAGGEIYRPV